ncbi:hypothetical protein PSPO01_11120 [Paraphaeosphaeria sporulosa]
MILTVHMLFHRGGVTRACGWDPPGQPINPKDSPGRYCNGED